MGWAAFCKGRLDHQLQRNRTGQDRQERQVEGHGHGNAAARVSCFDNP